MEPGEVREMQNGATDSDRPVPIDLDDHSLYLNRELELLKFQERVLEEASDPANPLLERAKFLAIVGSNMAEFYMVRVAGLKQMVEAHVTDISPDGRTAQEQLDEVRVIAPQLLRDSRVAYLDVATELEAEGIHLLQYQDLDAPQRIVADDYFEHSAFPVLTPLAFDPGRPFPHISNLSLNLAILLRNPEGEEHFARIKMPKVLPRLIEVGPPGGGRGELGLRSSRKERYFVWLEQIVKANLSALFPGMEVLEAHPFRVTRDAEVEIQELEADDLLLTIEQGVRRRRFGDVVRVTLTPETSERIRSILLKNLDVDPDDLVVLSPPLGGSDLMMLADIIDRPDLRYPPFVPVTPERLQDGGGDDNDLFTAIRERDILLHRPFESFDPVVRLVQCAAYDPKVLAIKMTLYRVGRNSAIVEALLEAAREGKEVTVLVELKARFDEESNIDWARALEQEGVHVVYGLVGLKTHSKVALVVRREGRDIRRYVHIGTGNYNTSTATQYTDLDLLTVNEEIAEDASQLFNFLTGYAAGSEYQQFLVSPRGARDGIEQLIRREMDHAAAGRPARMTLKTNSLTDRRLIRLLYEASRAGVRIDLIVRGVCCLRPGVAEVSETITVRSIVGRFLEHTRIYYFENAGEPECLIGSADLMTRNLDRRVEVLVPVLDPEIVHRLRTEVLDTYLADNVKTREMQPDGSYQRVTQGPGDEPINAQEFLIRRAGGKS
ncbi:MAG: polyphosphate kinase 1 [Anaerosomatales bacterium]